MSTLRILETCLYAEDLERAEEFYTKVLGLQLFAREPGRHLFFKCSNQMFLIFAASKTIADTEIAPHGSVGPAHVAFAVLDSELDSWATRLSEFGIGIEKILSWPKGGRSIYFRDPAGNCLELASPKIWGIEEAQ